MATKQAQVRRHLEALKAYAQNVRSPSLENVADELAQLVGVKLREEAVSKHQRGERVEDDDAS